jgi:hypothetical protein
MQTLASFLIAEHIKDLHAEADEDRLARLAASDRNRATWRRQVGNGARRLSIALDGLAAQLDPATCRPSYGRE